MFKDNSKVCSHIVSIILKWNVHITKKKKLCLEKNVLEQILFLRVVSKEVQL